jgi:hypothetical protein
METIRVDICYRPLRVAWAIHSSDLEGFREAVRLNHTLWGGRFNPIVLVDREEAVSLVNLFRADLIWPLGRAKEVKDFPARFPYLITPFFGDALFLQGRDEVARAQLLDMRNALVHWRGTTGSEVLTDEGICTFGWNDSDPLSDTFLMQYGAYPEPKTIGVNYSNFLSEITFAEHLQIDRWSPIREETQNRPSLAYLSRRGLERHYSIPAGGMGRAFTSGMRVTSTT